MPTFFPPPAPPPPPPKGIGILLPAAKLTKVAPAIAASSPPTSHALVPVRPTPQLQSLASTISAQGMATAHALTQAATGGDAAAQQSVLDLVGSARAGDPSAISAANALSLAQKLQVQAKYVNKWRGQSAALLILKGAHMGLVQFAT